MDGSLCYIIIIKSILSMIHSIVHSGGFERKYPIRLEFITSKPIVTRTCGYIDNSLVKHKPTVGELTLKQDIKGRRTV